MKNEKTYICKCNAYQCQYEDIVCLDDVDCRVECNGDDSCFHASIVWPSNANGDIVCHGYEACAYITFPEPPNEEDFEFSCDSGPECYGSTIKCPLYGGCHITCSDFLACDSTTIIWSDQFVESTLSCSSEGCTDTTTKPPYFYTKTFDDIYDLSSLQTISNTTTISPESHIYFEMKMNPMSTTSHYEILSIVDNSNNKLMSFCLEYETNIIEIEYGDNNLIYSLYGIWPKDDQYHSIEIIFNQKNKNQFKMDGDIYLDVTDTISIYSSFENNVIYAVSIGQENQEYAILCNIKNITISSHLSNYYYVPGIYFYFYFYF